MLTPYFVPPPQDLAAGANLQDFSNYWHTATHTGVAGEYFEFLKSLAKRESNLASALKLRTKNVANVYVVITPGRASGRDEISQARNNVDSFTRVWDKIDTRPFFRQTAYGLPTYGLTATEIEWMANQPVALHPVDARALGWITPWGFWQSNNLPVNTPLLRVGVFDYHPLIPGRWIVTQADHDVNPADWGAVRSCVQSALFIIEGMKSWVTYVNKYGEPTLHFKTGDNVDKELRKTIHEIISYWHKHRAIVTQEKDGLEILTIDPAANSRVGSSDVQERLINMNMKFIDRTITGGTLNQSSGTSGSYGLGSIHADAAQAIYSDDLGNIANSLNHQLIKVWMQRNRIEGPRPEITLFSAKGTRDLHNSISTIGYLAQSNNLEIEDLSGLEKIVGLKLRKSEQPDSENSDELSKKLDIV